MHTKVIENEIFVRPKLPISQLIVMTISTYRHNIFFNIIVNSIKKYRYLLSYSYIIIYILLILNIQPLRYSKFKFTMHIAYTKKTLPYRFLTLVFNHSVYKCTYTMCMCVCTLLHILYQTHGLVKNDFRGDSCRDNLINTIYNNKIYSHYSHYV